MSPSGPPAISPAIRPEHHEIERSQAAFRVEVGDEEGPGSGHTGPRASDEPVRPIVRVQESPEARRGTPLLEVSFDQGAPHEVLGPCRGQLVANRLELGPWFWCMVTGGPLEFLTLKHDAYRIGRGQARVKGSPRTVPGR
jgi:hypothetical protein